MTAREHIENYESRVREYTNFTVRGIKRTCKECGPREPGSEAERKAQKLMAKELESCCDSVQLEPFTLAPRAFLAWVNLSVYLGLLSAALFNFGYALASVLLLLLALVLVVLEFLMYKQTIDVVYPKKTSQNVVAVRKPAGGTQRRLIFCGHADSAYEWLYTYLGDKYFHTTSLLVVVVAVCFVAIIFGFVASLIAVFTEGGGVGGLAGLANRPGWLKVLGYIFAALCIPLLSGLGFKNNKHVVMGANDNLSGCFTGMAVAKLLGDLDLRLENTELVVLCSGGEECGLRGAKAFAKAHAEEYKDAETIFITLDTIRDYEHMAIYVRDLTGTVKHDPAVANLLRAGGKAAGFDLPFANLFFGASDGAAATQAGLRTTSFAAMDPAPAAYYHTRLDTADNLDPKTVEATLQILLETVYLFDAEGLAPFEGMTAKMGE
ncbi:MAG: Zn-dependent exopeptidase M28 [Oscillospiraceae bacterium]|nr:Zn-dependent exopeptidase M28 [Oscillospiraceae bacterium]